MADSSIMIDLNDPRTAEIADVISNKTSKKILNAIAESELSETEISTKLNLPLNTIGYNIKKLESAGLIEKTGGFLWSVKGKRIHKYKISNKKIVISPKSIVKGIIPTLIITGAIALGIKLYSPSFIQETQDAIQPARIMGEQAQDYGQAAGTILAEKAADSANTIQTITSITEPNYWLWFSAGALSAILIYLVYNYFKKD